MIAAAIIAGGRGTRMRSVSSALPKPMLPVGGKPLLEHTLEWLRAAGIDAATLCVGYKAESISRHFGDGSRWGMRLSYSVESKPRGTAGAVRDMASPAGDLLVVYGDLFIAMDCRRLLEFHAGRPGAASVVVCETDHPRDSDLVDLDGERVSRFYRAREGEPCGKLALAAVWVLRPELLELVPRDRPSDFGRDIFPKALAEGKRLNGYVTTEMVVDIGTPERRDRFLKSWPPRTESAPPRGGPTAGGRPA